jgi:hypothetical protein
MSEHPRQTPVREAFARGIASGRDPMNATALSGGVGVTNLRSPWLQRPCARCSHTFRRGDRVEVQPGGRFMHAAGTPFCGDDPARSPAAPEGEARPIEPATSPVRTAFYAGIALALPPPAGAPIVRLDPGHPLLAPAGPAFGRAACAICGHSLRPFDQVVICPCSPEAPLCRSAVHRDPLRLMMCWDDWKNSHLGNYCPATSRRLP